MSLSQRVVTFTVLISTEKAVDAELLVDECAIALCEKNDLGAVALVCHACREVYEPGEGEGVKCFCGAWPSQRILVD